MHQHPLTPDQLKFYNEQANNMLTVLKTVAHAGCIQSLGGVSMTDSEGLWPQLVCCAPHLSMVPLILDKV
jgi:hypothetical protein